MRRLLSALLCLLQCRALCGAIATYPLGLSAAAQLLEVTLPSARPALRAAYRKKAAASHPDVCKHADAAAQFLRITAAYETLLQFSIVAPPQAPPSPPPQGAAQRRPNKAGARNGGEADNFARRVAAWRAYWVVALQASQMASEAERKAAQQAVLAGELVRLRDQLQSLLRREDGARSAAVDGCRARYAQCSSRHADASCDASTLRARARQLQEEAQALQRDAQGATA
jgi:DnaJ-class molecular chaperone with C-terminal Zn finger domain